MTPNPFDQGARYVAKLEPPGFLRWLLPEVASPLKFHGWLDSRSIPFPSDPDRFCDTVAGFLDATKPGNWWALPVEFQTRPDGELFGRLLEYLGRLWRELRPPGIPQGRFQVVAAVNLTGAGSTTRDMVLGASLRTALIVVEHNLRDEDAAETLARILDGVVARCLLPFIPLMRGGGGVSIIQRWKDVAQTEPEVRRRADYAGLALVFAELTNCRPAWKVALEGWNVEQSLQVLEWQAEAAKRAKSEAVLRVLRKRFPSVVPQDIEEVIMAASDMDQLDRWLDDAATASTLAQFRRLAGLQAQNGSRKKANGGRPGRRRKGLE